jgi:topoisomerase-4 subunit A
MKLAVVREIPEEHDHVAVIGDNRKLVLFSLTEMPLMAKGQGVTLQRYRDGGLSDITTLKLEDGLTGAWAATAAACGPRRTCVCGRSRAGPVGGCRLRDFLGITNLRVGF